MNFSQSSSVPPSTVGKNLTVYICIHVVMPSAVAIGVIGNLLSILVFSRREMIKFCVSIFTIVLAVSDILLLTTSLFNIILPDFLGGDLSDGSVFWCHFHGYFDLLFAATSGYSVVFISVERWFSIWKPFKKAQYVTFKSTLITVISFILISGLAFLWFPFTLTYYTKQPHSDNSCELSRPIVYKIFGTISVIFTYIIPFFSLGILNILIVYRLHTRNNTTMHRGMVQACNSAGSDTLLGTSARKRQQRQRNVDRNITFMLITIAVAFMVMTFPYQIYWFYLQIRQLSTDITLFTLTQTFRYLNCCCNFFLYSATSSLFRRQLKEIFQFTNSSKTNNKHINEERRPTALLALPICATEKNNVASENNNLLSPTNAKISETKIDIEDSNPVDSKNGPMNSCIT